MYCISQMQNCFKLNLQKQSAGRRGKQGDVSQRVQNFSYKMSSSKDLMYSLVTIVTTVLHPWNLLREQILSILTRHTHKRQLCEVRVHGGKYFMMSMYIKSSHYTLSICTILFFHYTSLRLEKKFRLHLEGNGKPLEVQKVKGTCERDKYHVRQTRSSYSLTFSRNVESYAVES